MPEYKDWLGQPIEVGSPVLYAVSNSHYAQVVWAEVLAITDVEPETRNLYDDQRKVVVGHEDHWPYGRKFKLKVQPYFQSDPSGASQRSIDTEWDTADGKWAEGAGLVYKRVLPKPAFIQNIEKVTVFPLPEEVRAQLDAEVDTAVNAGNERMAARRNA